MQHNHLCGKRMIVHKKIQEIRSRFNFWANSYVICYNLWYCTCISKCTSTYYKSTDAPLWRVPFKAAVDVAACVDQEHDAASNSVEVLQQHLKMRQKQNKWTFKVRNVARKTAWCYLHDNSLHCKSMCVYTYKPLVKTDLITCCTVNMWLMRFCVIARLVTFLHKLNMYCIVLEIVFQKTK